MKMERFDTKKFHEGRISKSKWSPFFPSFPSFIDLQRCIQENGKVSVYVTQLAFGRLVVTFRIPVIG